MKQLQSEDDALQYFGFLLVTHRYLRYAVVKIIHIYTIHEHRLEMEITSYQYSKLNVTEKPKMKSSSIKKINVHDLSETGPPHW